MIFLDELEGEFGADLLCLEDQELSQDKDTLLLELRPLLLGRFFNGGGKVDEGPEGRMLTAVSAGVSRGRVVMVASRTRLVSPLLEGNKQIKDSL